MMRGPIWLITEDKSLEHWGKENFGERLNIVTTDTLDAPIISPPELVLLTCDYQCYIERCARHFSTALRLHNVPIRMVRPVLVQEFHNRTGSYTISNLRQPSTTPLEEHSDNYVQLCCSANTLTSSHQSMPIIIRLEAEIIGRRGCINMQYLASSLNRRATWLSTQFSRAVGLKLKSFANKIKLCDCLWETVSGLKPIKTIAIEHGYKPAAFSRTFFRTFNIWPTEIRALFVLK
jgi:AraC-like DNA-binding protein